MEEKVLVYVELLDEGTPTLRPASAVPIGDGLYRLLADEDYDPEDEAWDFAPGSPVRLEEEPLHGGGRGLVAKHPNPKALRIYVQSGENFAPPLRDTYALPLENGLYEVQATPHYTPSQLWEFPPGSAVRLQPTKIAFPGWEPLIAVSA